jgi:hypothetical protein
MQHFLQQLMNKKEIRAKIQQLKKSIPKGDKKRKKEVADEIAKLEQELNALTVNDGDGDLDSIEPKDLDTVSGPTNIAEDERQDLKDAMTQLNHTPEELKETVNGQKKPSRQQLRKVNILSKLNFIDEESSCNGKGNGRGTKGSVSCS